MTACRQAADQLEIEVEGMKYRMSGLNKWLDKNFGSRNKGDAGMPSVKEASATRAAKDEVLKKISKYRKACKGISTMLKGCILKD